jgi:hypothetical protein
MSNLKTVRPDQCDKIVGLITKYKLNTRYLATKLDISYTNFYQKQTLVVNSNGSINKFTPSQKEKLTEVIQNIGVELQKIEK